MLSRSSVRAFLSPSPCSKWNQVHSVRAFTLTRLEVTGQLEWCALGNAQRSQYLCCCSILSLWPALYFTHSLNISLFRSHTHTLGAGYSTWRHKPKGNSGRERVCVLVVFPSIAFVWWWCSNTQTQPRESVTSEFISRLSSHTIAPSQSTFTSSAHSVQRHNRLCRGRLPVSNNSHHHNRQHTHTPHILPGIANTKNGWINDLTSCAMIAIDVFDQLDSSIPPRVHAQR